MCAKIKTTMIKKIASDTFNTLCSKQQGKRAENDFSLSNQKIYCFIWLQLRHIYVAFRYGYDAINNVARNRARIE